MKNLETLINELCPEGVEFVKLGDVCEVQRGKRLTKKQLSDQDNYPVFHGGIQPIGYYSKCNRKANTVMIINVGASAGTIGFCGQDFWSSDGCYCLSHVNELSARYLYFLLSKNQHYFQSKVRHGGIPTLDALVVKNFEIPLPPIEVQTEIVRILDKFTELEAELDCRKRQYEYYRDKLLSFENVGGQNVEWKKMSEICLSICSGGTPLTSKPEYYDGDIPWLRTQEVDYCEINSTLRNITQLGLDNSSAKMIPSNCVIVAMYGATAAKVAINKIPLCTNQACCNLQIDESKAKVRYVYQWLCKQYEVLKALGEGSQHNINAKKVKDFAIPIPPLAEQERIVSILDRFESLTTSLTAGLPAEIAARRQQYEHYRDKLLTFKRKSA